MRTATKSLSFAFDTALVDTNDLATTDTERAPRRLIHRANRTALRG
jgi:hypothetical protein